jgi:hypothetical protein
MCVSLRFRLSEEAGRGWAPGSNGPGGPARAAEGKAVVRTGAAVSPRPCLGCAVELVLRVACSFNTSFFVFVGGGCLYTARARAQPPPPPRWGRAPGSNGPGGPRPTPSKAKARPWPTPSKGLTGPRRRKQKNSRKQKQKQGLASAYRPSPCIFILVFFFGRLASPLGLSFFWDRLASPLKPSFFFPAAEEKKSPPIRSRNTLAARCLAA